jgi:omega-amidase
VTFCRFQINLSEMFGFESVSLCNTYADAFMVPVIYINSVGKLEYMPGKMGAMMKKAGFTMNGKSKIYTSNGHMISCDVEEAKGYEIDILDQIRKKDIRFYGDDFTIGNFIFRTFILKPEIIAGIKQYNENRK